MNALTQIKILSSHGHFITDMKGNIIERHDETGELPKVRVFRFQHWFYKANRRPLRAEMDILELVYVTEDGHCELPELSDS